MPKTWTISPALLLGLLVLLGAGCGAPRRLDTPARDTLIVGRPTDVQGLDPARQSSAESGEVCEQIFDHLVRFRAGSTEIEPDLASSWEMDRNGTVWTFHLRPGIQFQDGTPLDAEAVKFSFERQIRATHPYHTGAFAWESTYSDIVSIEALDSLTVRFTIEAAYAPFLATLAMFPAAIVSPAAVARWGDRFDEHPVGTGPFRLAEWVPGDRLTLERNPRYWGPRPRVDHLVFRTIRDARQRLIALEGGAIDVAYSIAPDDVQFVALHPDLQLLSVSASSLSYLALNTAHPPLDDVRVRRAVNYAVNRDAIVKLLYQGGGEPASGIVPPTVWGHEDDFHYDYDPARARELLAEAGFAPKRPLQLFAPETERPYLPQPEAMARVIADELDAVGIPTQVVVVKDFGEYLVRTGNGEHDLALLGWVGDNGDPDDFLYVLLNREQIGAGANNNNLAFYQSAQVEGLLKYAQTSQDRAERARYYARAQRVVAADAPLVPIAYSQWTIAARADVRGLELSPTSIVYYGGAGQE